MNIKRNRLYLLLALLAVLLGGVAGFVAVHMTDLPEITALEEYKPSATTRVFDDEGGLIAEFYMENRTPVTLDRVPKHVVHAFLSVEDPRFYHHSGIDLIGVSRAMLKNIAAGHVVQGGSTITQQLTKMLFLEPEKTFTRKLKEALLALQIERHYSKDEILAMYLNQVYLGSGAYGVEAAAHIYFGKTVDQLTLGEGAMLAGLPQAPSKYSPFLNPTRAKERRLHSLKRMVEEGYISRDEMEAADNEPIVTRPTRFISSKAPYFVEYIRQYLEEKYGPETLYRGGLNIYTTLNLKMQENAEAAVQKGVAEVMKRHPRKGYEIQGALLAIEPHTGYIKSMVGGTDFSKSQFNRATQAHRQPGSAFKPIVYAAALEKGYKPDDIVMDAPVSYPGAVPGKPWRPMNYDKKFEGPITLRHALARSVNVVAVRLLSDVGIPKVIGCANRLGIKSDMPPYLPLALGASDATLMEMTGAFAAFDNFGAYTEPSSIIKITDREGRVLEDNRPQSKEAVSAATAVTLTDMLTSVVQHGTGWKARELKRPVAGKTGTTSDYHDAWFIGYVPSLALGVWVGYDDHKPIGSKETGAEAALPIWLDFMKGYVKDFDVPAEEFPVLPPQGFQEISGLNLKVGGAVKPVESDKASEAPEEEEGPADSVNNVRP